MILIKMNRRSPYVSMIGDDSDDDADTITSYCPKCLKYDIQTLLGPRIYGLNEPEASDHDKWMQCPKCGYLLPKVHAQQESQIVPFIEPPKTIFDSKSAKITPIHDRNKQFQKAKLNTRPIGSDREDIIKKDKDLQLMLAKGKQLISYSDSDR